MTRSLAALLNPKSIAVFGGREAEAVATQALALGFKGKIWPVHPAKKQICGLKAYRSVEELPGIPDAAYVAVNRQRTVEIVKALAGVGAGGAICYASGFGETDETGQNLQQALVEAAGDMPVVGPNCYGLLNYLDGIALWPDQHGGVKLEDGQKGVAIIAQSSNIAVNLTMQQRALPLAYVLTAGNQAQTGLSDLALGLLDDPRVTALGLHIEGFDSIEGIEAVAKKARALNKPVVAMKIGRSEQAQKAAFTHTASLSGKDEVADAFLKRIGIARVHSLPSLLETLKLLHVCGPLEGYSLSSMSCSGGEAGLIADASAGRKVYFREMSREEKLPVEHALGPMVTVANPLDYHTYIWADRAGLETTFTAMMSAGFDLNCLILDFPRSDRCSGDDWQVTLDALEAASAKTAAKSCVIATLHENISEAQADALIKRGIAPLSGIGEALDAIEAAAQIGEAWQSVEFTPVTHCLPVDDLPQQVLDEDHGKNLLSRYGVTIPQGKRVSDPQEAAELTETIGYPIVLKALGIAHKSEQNAVRLNLHNQQVVEDAARELRLLVDHIYVEAMVQNPVMELLVGLVRDPQTGLVMTLATGGTMVEVFRDSQILLLPINWHDAERALRKLKSAVFFDGFRGRPKADINAAVETILNIQSFALDHCDRLIELDVNPLIVTDKAAIAADVLIRLGRNMNE